MRDSGAFPGLHSCGVGMSSARLFPLWDIITLKWEHQWAEKQLSLLTTTCLRFFPFSFPLISVLCTVEYFLLSILSNLTEYISFSHFVLWWCSLINSLISLYSLIWFGRDRWSANDKNVNLLFYFGMNIWLVMLIIIMMILIIIILLHLVIIRLCSYYFYVKCSSN